MTQLQKMVMVVLFMRLGRYHDQKFRISKVANIMTLAGHQNGYI